MTDGWQASRKHSAGTLWDTPHLYTLLPSWNAARVGSCWAVGLGLDGRTAAFDGNLPVFQESYTVAGARATFLRLAWFQDKRSFISACEALGGRSGPEDVVSRSCPGLSRLTVTAAAVPRIAVTPAIICILCMHGVTTWSRWSRGRGALVVRLPDGMVMFDARGSLPQVPCYGGPRLSR